MSPKYNLGGLNDVVADAVFGGGFGLGAEVADFGFGGIFLSQTKPTHGTIVNPSTNHRRGQRVRMCL